jgi:hypothetical protein
MKMWRLGLLILVSAGLFASLGLSGCGDNPCDDNPCGSTVYGIPDSCLVIEEEDYACLCCTADGGILCNSEGIKLPDPPPPPSVLESLETQWDENSKTCIIPE